MSAGTWRRPSSHPMLGSGDVHVWMTWLDPPAGRIAHLTSLLTEHERDRAQRFHFDRDRDRYVVGRGVLRELLGLYLKREPARVELIYGPNGKPELAGYGVDHALQFNLAHSDRLALYAFTLGRLIGIDVEKKRPLSDAGGLARRYFSSSEYATWLALAPGDRLAAFFRCWTSKEAFIKALGAGLSYPLDQFDVSLAPGEPLRLLTIAGDEEEARRWTVRELQPGREYAAAVVAQDTWRLSRWRYDPPLNLPEVFDRPA